MSKIWLFFAVVLIAASGARAQAINAKTCNEGDVQAAFNSVTPSTTTINIPAGTCYWTSQLSISVPTGNTNLSILGAGSLSTNGGGDATVIVDNDTTDSNWLINFDTGSANGAKVRLAGITFEAGTGQYKDNGMILFVGYSHNLRVDHFHLNATTATGGANSNQYAILRFANGVLGVFDHSIVDGGAALTFYLDQYGGPTNDGAGYASWADTDQLGTANAFYVENNTFNDNQGKNSQFMNDCYAGGRAVIRFNTMNNDDVQTHPTGGAGNLRGCRVLEVYQNTFNGSNSTPTFDTIWMSSGTGMFWGNSAPTGYTNFFDVHSMRINSSTYAQTAAPNGWGYCGTSFNGTGSAWDQNSNSSGYRCLDEPGTGKSDLLQGWFPITCDVTTGGCSAGTYTGTWPHQALSPFYEWQNTWNAVPSDGGSYMNLTAAPALQANVDFYEYTTSFNGTSGVGAGPLSSRPSSCRQGVGYWATDQGNWNKSGSGGQGELFVCSATNTWTAYYTPYTYPHPLVGGTTSSQEGPGAPSNLTGSVQ